MAEVLDIADSAGVTIVTVPLDRAVTKIGTLTSSHVRLEGEGVSRMHAVIERSAGGTRIIDLGSNTGTFVNEEKVDQAVLRDGDVVRIGTRHLRYRGSYSSVAFGEDAVDVPRTTRPCPRCQSRLVEQRWATGGAYRGNGTMPFLRCASCFIAVIEGEVVRARYDRKEARLGGTVLERDRRDSNKNCPHCPGELEHLTLGWAAMWVEVEECPRCGAVVLDDGEGALLDALLHRGSGG